MSLLKSSFFNSWVRNGIDILLLAITIGVCIRGCRGEREETSCPLPRSSQADLRREYVSIFMEGTNVGERVPEIQKRVNGDKRRVLENEVVGQKVADFLSKLEHETKRWKFDSNDIVKILGEPTSEVHQLRYIRYEYECDGVVFEILFGLDPKGLHQVVYVGQRVIASKSHSSKSHCFID